MDRKPMGEQEPDSRREHWLWLWALLFVILFFGCIQLAVKLIIGDSLDE